MFATDLQDNVLLPKVVIGDLVALEVKYHNACLTRLKNRHRSFSSQTNSVNKKQRAQSVKDAVIQVFHHIKNQREAGTKLFQLSKLYDYYLECFNDMSDNTSKKNKIFHTVV